MGDTLPYGRPNYHFFSLSIGKIAHTSDRLFKTSQTSKIRLFAKNRFNWLELFAKIAISFQLLIIFVKGSISDLPVCQGSECAFVLTLPVPIPDKEKKLS